MLDSVLSRQPMSFRYHNRAALVMSALQVEKNPLCAPGPCTPVGVHSHYAIPRWRLPAHAIHAALTLSPPRGVRPAPNSPKMKLRFNPHFIISVSHTQSGCQMLISYLVIAPKRYTRRGALPSFLYFCNCLVYFTRVHDFIDIMQCKWHVSKIHASLSIKYSRCNELYL